MSVLARAGDVRVVFKEYPEDEYYDADYRDPWDPDDEGGHLVTPEYWTAVRLEEITPNGRYRYTLWPCDTEEEANEIAGLLEAGGVPDWEGQEEVWTGPVY